MNVPVWVWLATVAGILAVIAFDLWVVDRGGPREFTIKQATRWVIFYVSLAVLFGLGMWMVAGGEHSLLFFGGYIMEYSLSVDNLFIFYLIMANFAVPRAHQHRVLLVGILIALVMRAIFIFAGVAAVNQFKWLFFIFGAFLIYTAFTMLQGDDHDEDYKGNALIRWSRRVIPSTEDYHGSKLTVRLDGKRLATPMLMVMIAIGVTDLLFALDSIPAIIGLTHDSYIVFTANAFALMGLRQLYFLLGGLLERLVYLNYGLSLILAFIGVKLILEALHKYDVAWAPEISAPVSVGVIAVTLLVTTVASLWKSRRDARAVKTADESGGAV